MPVVPGSADTSIVEWDGVALRVGPDGRMEDGLKVAGVPEAGMAEAGVAKPEVPMPGVPAPDVARVGPMPGVVGDASVASGPGVGALPKPDGAGVTVLGRPIKPPPTALLGADATAGIAVGSGSVPELLRVVRSVLPLVPESATVGFLGLLPRATK